jgi:tetratricopeptide (TPR) repeat protein
MSQYAASRENAMAPANAATQCHDYERAFALYQQVVDSYPTDARALMMAARAALRAGRLEESIPLFKQSLAQGGRYSYSERFYLMSVYIKLNRWDDFEGERLDARKASLAGDKTLSAEKGYLIDTIQSKEESINVTEFPTLHAPYRIRDRFLLYEEKDPCSGYTPYVDLESDDADQADFVKRHPSQAAAGDRSFSLVAYLTPDSPVLLKSYRDGEPSYHTDRADFLALIDKLLTAHRNLRTPCTLPATPPQTQGSH